MLTTSAHYKCSLQVLTTSAHYKCSLQVLTTSAHYKCSLQVLTTSAHYKCSLQVLTTSAHYKYSLQVLTTSTHVPSVEKASCMMAPVWPLRTAKFSHSPYVFHRTRTNKKRSGCQHSIYSSLLKLNYSSL